MSKRWTDKIFSGNMSDIGYAPLLFGTVVIGIVLFINSVLTGKSFQNLLSLLCIHFPPTSHLCIGHHVVDPHFST